MTSFAEIQQEFATVAQKFVDFRREYPDPQTVSLPIARREGKFDYACREIRSSLHSLNNETYELAQQSPNDLPAKPDSVTDAYIWPFIAVSAEVDGQPLTLDDALTAFKPYQNRLNLGAAYSTFQRLESSSCPDDDFKRLERQIGTWPQSTNQFLQNREDLRRFIVFDCSEFGYTSDELTNEVRRRMSQAHKIQAELQFLELTKLNPLTVKTAFDYNVARYIFWGVDDQTFTEYYAENLRSAFNRNFQSACRCAARNEALAVMQNSAYLDCISGSSLRASITRLTQAAGVTDLKEIFNSSEKIGDYVLTPDECVQRLSLAVQYHDAARNYRKSLGLR